MSSFALGFAEALGWFVVYIPLLVFRSAFTVSID